MKKRITALILVLVMVMSLVPQVSAASIEDYPSGVNVMIRSETPHTYLDVQTGGYTVGLSGRIWSYVTADNKVTGPAYCISHGSGYPNGYIAVNTTPYTANPKMTAAFSSGYPLVSLETFLALHPSASGLTKDEYGYATQVAVWAALGQVSVEGTAYTSGAETVVKPTDAAKLRVFNALTAILESASGGGTSGIGMRIRSAENANSDTVDLGSTTSLAVAAQSGSGGIQTETIGGKEYFTCEFSLACTSMPSGGTVTLTVSGAPSGTILTDGSNQALAGNAVTLSASGSEYAGKFKVCVPSDAAEASSTGSITIQAAASIASCTFYLVDNSHAYEQDFIIADPNSGSTNASGTLKWGERSADEPDTGSIRLLKTDENGAALAGAEFDIDGSGGYHASGTTDANGSITWTDLPVGQGYTITETAAPEGYQLAEPISVTARAGQTVYVTVTDSSEKTFRVHKQDKQSGFSLEGAVFRFEQIDGSFNTEGRTGADGIIEFTPSKLPYGSYRVTEISAPEGYEKDTSVKTVNWDGKADIDLYFTNTRKPGFKILKVDANTNVPLSGAYFDVYKDGALITSVRTNEVGIATVSGVSEGYYEAVERIAPYGYVLDTSRHGIHIDPLDPSSNEDPVLRITNKRMPALRIVKYDAQTTRPLANVTFEVYRDTRLIGEYTTDSRGEIYLYDLAPGTYTAVEVAAPDTHVVNSTPQSIELVAGATETYNLIFFNFLKPGIHLRKLDSQTLAPLANAKFRITQVGGTFSQEYTSDANGGIDLTGLEPGSYTVVELSAPDGYLIDDAERIIRIEGGDNAEFVFTNTKKPAFRLVKIDSLTGERLAGATFRIARIADGSHYLDRVTDTNGEINISDLEPGVFSVQEMAAPEGYVLDSTEYHVELFPGQTSQLVVSNDVKPDLRIVKKDADTGEYLDGATFKVKKADGATLTAEETNENGEIILKGLDPGVYEVIEQAPPVGYLPARQSSQLITLTANKLGTVIFQNYAKPTLTVNKISSVSGEPLQGAKFKVTYRSNNTETGSMQNFGNFLTDGNGRFSLTDLTDGWYTITELESVPGYSIKEATQEVYIKGGEDKVLTFENIPLSALVVYKYDTVDGTAVGGAVFQVKKLTDTSGTGGTVIGTYRTTANGSFTVTGLAEGAYVVEEIASDSGHVIDAAPQTAYISGKQTDVVELYFGNTPKGSILIKKIDTVTHEPLSGVEFLVTDSAGTLIGNANGKYVSDSAGTILIDNLDPAVTLVVKETRAKENYVLDDTPQTIKVRAGHTVSLEFRNAPYGGLLIQKVDSTTKEPLAGAVFEVKTSSGAYADNYGGMTSSNGRYVTDANGQIRLYDLEPNTFVVTEVQAPEHYVLNAEPQTVRVYSGDLQTLLFGNPKKGALTITKRDSVTGAPMEGVKFLIKNSSGEPAGDGEYATNASGQITLTDLAPGTFSVTETATISGYVLDTTVRSVVIKAGETRTLNLTNKPKGNLVVQKIDSITKEPLAGAVFKITTADGTLVDDNEGLTSSTGLYTTDQNGQIYLSKLTPATYVITEQTAPANYKLASNSRTVVVRAADTQTVTITNEPLCTLTLLKRDAVTKEPLKGAEFIVKYSDGTLIGTDNGRYITGSDGTVTVSGLKPDATVVVTEQRAPTGYIKDDAAQSIVVRSGVANALTFDNEPTTTLIIRKYIEGTQYEPLAGVAFKVIDGSGAAVGPDDGVYYTDEAGEIVLDGIEPGATVTAREIKTVDGFVLNGHPQTILIKEGQVQALTFWNQRKGSVVIRKLDSVTKQPLEGVEFKIAYADGRVVDNLGGKISSNGIYYTNSNGEIRVSGVTGTLVITEEKSIPGYTINESSRTQTVVVNPNDTQVLTFYNDPDGGLELIKVDAANRSKRLAGVVFEIRGMDGELITTLTTDKNGRASVRLESGSYYAAEIEAAGGYKLDGTPHYFTVKDGKTTALTVTNTAVSGIVIHKTDATTGKGIYGARFLLYDSSYNTVGEYTSDDQGYVRIENLETGRYYLRELANEGYVVDTQRKTVNVKSGETTLVEWKNTPITGQIQITKTSADYNSVNGWAAGTPIPDTVFEIYNKSGVLVDTIQTDRNGVAASRALPLGRYKIVESKAAANYVLDKTPIEVEIEFSGQIVRAAMTNKSLYTNVSIKKTGYTEVMPGQTIQYMLTGIGNNSTTSLTSFYWRDTLPTQAVRLDKVVTGTWNAQGNYKLVYKTNYSGETWRTLADNLSTFKNYVLDASPAALNLGSGEYVTEFMFSFGVVPANFRQVESPKVYCTVLSTLTSGTKFTNTADVGGVYSGQWIMATSRWTTTVYAPSKPLPRTGY